jgi:TolB protein
MTSSNNAGPRNAPWYNATAITANPTNRRAEPQRGQRKGSSSGGLALAVGSEPAAIAAILSPVLRAAGALAPLLLLPFVLACGDLPLAVEGSPSDGVVFVRIEDGQPDLARGRLSDGEVVGLTHTPDREESWPYWSELSRHLAFQVGPLNDRGDADLILWVPRTGEEIPLTRTPRRAERWPAWSPTQQRLVFAFLGVRGAGLGVFDLEARNARMIVRAPGQSTYLRPTFSPDGRRIVAQRRGEDGRGSELFVLREGEEPLQVTSDINWFNMKAWFTRDGRRIVYSRRPSGGLGWFEIAQVSAAGGSPRVLAAKPDSDAHSARPSPTRDEIVFVSDRGGDFDLYLMNADGSDVRQLTRTPERHEFAPRWSPDGERLLVTVAEPEYGLPRLTDRESLSNARVVALTRDGEVLFDTLGFMPDWMPPW